MVPGPQIPLPGRLWTDLHAVASLDAPAQALQRLRDRGRPGRGCAGRRQRRRDFGGGREHHQTVEKAILDNPSRAGGEAGTVRGITVRDKELSGWNWGFAARVSGGLLSGEGSGGKFASWARVPPLPGLPTLPWVSTARGLNWLSHPTQGR